jgi:hypothetical protein
MEKSAVMAEKLESFEKIAIIGNLVEAQVIEFILTEREIPFRIRSFHDTAYDGLFQFQKGWGEIYAPTDHSEEILEILEDVRKGDMGEENA